MGFGDILSAGVNLLGAASAFRGSRDASRDADQQLDLQQQGIQADRERLALQQQYAGQIYQGEQDLYNYQLQQQGVRDAGAAEQQQYLRGLGERSFANTDQERAISLQRLSQLDSASAQQRALELEAYQRNQGLAGSERQFAIDAFGQQRDTAARERAFAEQLLSQNRALSQTERDFQLQQLQRQQGLLEEERGYGLEARRASLDRIDRLGAELDGLRGGFDELETGPNFDQTQVDDLMRQLQQDYRADTDYAARGARSTNEANLIARGMDASSAADFSRNQVASQLAQQYRASRNQARTDALSYITGIDNQYTQSLQRQIAGRNQQLAEPTGAYNAQLAALAQLPQFQSAANYRIGDVGTGIYNQQLGSATSFQAPIGVGSAQVNPTGVSLGVFNQFDPNLANYDTGAFASANPFSQFLNPAAPGARTAGLISGLGNVGGGNLSYAADQAALAQEGGQAASNALLEGIGNIFNDQRRREEEKAKGTNN